MNIKELTLKAMKAEKETHLVSVRLFGNVRPVLIVKKSENRRIIAGYANIAVVDSQNQLIPTEVLKAGIETLMSDPAYANLMLTHKNIQIGKIIDGYGDLETHVDDKGLYIVAEIRKDIKTADKVWEKILAGEINGFSIGCEVLDDHRQCDVNGENCIEVLDKINIFEVSACEYPVNEMSGFVVISKSKFNEDVCKDCNINNDNMKKKVKSEVEEKEVVEEEKTEAPAEEETNVEAKDETTELSVEERMENMERAIFNIEAAISKMTEHEDEDDEEEEEEEEKSEPESEPVEEEKADEPEVVEESNEMEELKKGIDTIIELLKSKEVEEKEEDDIENLKLAIKSRDDKIEALNKKVEILSKKDVEEQDPKTVNKSDEVEEVDDETSLMDDYNIKIKDGTIGRKRFLY